MELKQFVKETLEQIVDGAALAQEVVKERGGSINLGKKNDSRVEEVAITKVKFTIPLVLPPVADLRKG